MKIGEIVRRHIQAIFEYCEMYDASEFVRLQDPRYSKDTFGINYPFCKAVAKISQAEHARYLRDEYRVNEIAETVRNFVPGRILLRHWEAFFEHDGELAFHRVPFAHRTLPLG